MQRSAATPPAPTTRPMAWCALGTNTTGSDNTAIGVVALVSNTTGANNTATGYQALYHNTIGMSNTATGRNALVASTSWRLQHGRRR